jgi:hypothetical protein
MAGILTIDIFGLPQCIDRRSIDRRSIDLRFIDFQYIDDPSTDDPSTDDPSTILLAEFYNIDPHFIDRSGTSTAGFFAPKIDDYYKTCRVLAIFSRQLLPGPDLLQAYFWG